MRSIGTETSELARAVPCEDYEQEQGYRAAQYSLGVSRGLGDRMRQTTAPLHSRIHNNELSGSARARR